MGISTSDKPYLERIEDAKSDHFMQAAVAKAQELNLLNEQKQDVKWKTGMNGMIWLNKLDSMF